MVSVSVVYYVCCIDLRLWLSGLRPLSGRRLYLALLSLFLLVPALSPWLPQTAVGFAYSARRFGAAPTEACNKPLPTNYCPQLSLPLFPRVVAAPIVVVRSRLEPVILSLKKRGSTGCPRTGVGERQPQGGEK